MAELGNKRGSDDSSEEDEPIATPVGVAAATKTDTAASTTDAPATIPATPASSDDLSVSQSPLSLY